MAHLRALGTYHECVISCQKQPYRSGDGRIKGSPFGTSQRVAMCSIMFFSWRGCSSAQVATPTSLEGHGDGSNVISMSFCQSSIADAVRKNNTHKNVFDRHRNSGEQLVADLMLLEAQDQEAIQKTWSIFVCVVSFERINQHLLQS